LRFVSRLELVERGVRLEHRLLDEILGVGRIARHAERGPVELVDERHRIPLELVTLLRLLAVRHPRDSPRPS